MESLSRTLRRHPSSLELEPIVADLRRDGAVVIEGLIAPDVVDAVRGELEPHIASRPPGFRPDLGAGFYGANTIRVQGLVRKSPSFRDHVLVHPTLLGIADAVLLDHCGDYWMSQAETIYIGPGDPAQELHRDDVNWSIAARLGIDLQVSVLVAVGDYDAPVGATRVIPGSHHLTDTEIDHGDAISVEMEPGDALIYLGSTVHGGGANTTTDRWRRAVYVSYLLGWLVPEEAVAVSLDPEFVATLPDRARTLLGWSNLHGNPDPSGTRSEVQLWQLDEDDRHRYDGVFRHR